MGGSRKFLGGANMYGTAVVGIKVAQLNIL